MKRLLSSWASLLVLAEFDICVQCGDCASRQRVYPRYAGTGSGVLTMTDSPDGYRADLIARLRDEINAESMDAVTDVDPIAESLEGLQMPAPFDPMILATVDDLIGREAVLLSVPARQAMLAAVSSALEARRIWAGPLEPLLYELRVAERVARDEVATLAGIPSDEFHQLETGRLRLSDREPNEIVAWINAVKAPAQAAANALALSLGLRSAGAAYAGLSDAKEYKKDEDFWREVCRLLEVPSDPEASSEAGQTGE
jgi:hypothetical protein